jgi:CyaY protein
MVKLANDSNFLGKLILLKAVEHSCDRINDASLADIDNQRVGGMVAVSQNPAKIINLQKPLLQRSLVGRQSGRVSLYKFDSATGWTPKTG